MRDQEATAAASRRSRSEPAERYGQSVTLLNSSHGIIGTCTFTALALLAAYTHLLMISINYMKLVIIPVIMLAFIGAVACKSYYSSGGWQQYDNNSETGFANRVEMLVALAAVTFVPQLVQLVCSGLDKLFLRNPGLDKLVGQQQNNDSFLISHFLFFFSSSIGALQVMMVTLHVTKVSQVLQMTFSVLLNMSLHAKVTEWVGEDMVLVCMPELVAALLWFIAHFDHRGCTISSDNVIFIGYVRMQRPDIFHFLKKSFKSCGIVLGAAPAVFLLFAHESNVGPSAGATAAGWHVDYYDLTMILKVLVSCTLSGMLSYFSMWIISERDDSAKVPTQLLKFSAYVCFGISAILVSVLAIIWWCLVLPKAT